jgi:hypothetical protein
MTGQIIELLLKLPADMQADLQVEVVRPLMQTHPFFHRYIACFCDKHTIRVMVTDAVTEMILELGRRLFSVGETARGMYFVNAGQLRYLLMHDQMSKGEMGRGTHSTSRISALEDEPCAYELVHPREWLSEHALWMEAWRHLGIATSNCESEIFEIAGPTVHRILGDNPVAGYYARCFFDDDPGEHGTYKTMLPTLITTFAGPHADSDQNSGTDDERPQLDKQFSSFGIPKVGRTTVKGLLQDLSAMVTFGEKTNGPRASRHSSQAFQSVQKAGSMSSTVISTCAGEPEVDNGIRRTSTRSLHSLGSVPEAEEEAFFSDEHADRVRSAQQSPSASGAQESAERDAISSPSDGLLIQSKCPEPKPLDPSEAQAPLAEGPIAL